MQNDPIRGDGKVKNRLLPDGASLPHLIEQQSFDVRFAREDAAHRLLGPLSELNRTRLLPLIGRIFDEVDRQGEVIRIDRLDLDLGSLPEDGLGEVEARLEQALREALSAALAGHTAGRSGTDVAGRVDVARRPLAHALLDLFDHWLVHGSWPYGASIDLAVAPAELLVALLDSHAEALLAALRRRSGSETVLRRLVRQIPDAILQRLLHRLDAASAGWILAYMAETRAAHEEAPLIEETPEEFGRTLWLVVLRDALNRAGLRGNRRAFVENVVGGIAAAAGIDVAALVAELQRALAAAPAAARGDGSLLSILAEIGPQGALAAPELRALAALLAGTGAAGGGQAPERIVEAAIRRRPAEARRLLQEAMAEDPGSLLRRLHVPGGAAALLRLALGEAAAAWEGRLSSERGSEARERLLSDAARASLAAPSDRASAESGAAPSGDRGGAAAAGRDGGREWDHGRYDDGAADAPFAALDRAVEAMLAGASEFDAARFRQAVEAAFAADPWRLRRRLGDRVRRHPRLAAVLADAVPLDRAAAWLLPPHLAPVLGGFARLARASAADELAALIAAAAGLSSGAPAAVLAERLAEALGRRRREAPKELLERLAQSAPASPEAGGEALAAVLREALRPETGALARDLGRRRAADLLRALLHVRGAERACAEALERAVADLRGVAAYALLDDLAIGPGDRGRAAAALARLSPRALRRLLVLVAPEPGEARATLNRALGAAGAEPAALARLLAERLSGGGAEASRAGLGARHAGAGAIAGGTAGAGTEAGPGEGRRHSASAGAGAGAGGGSGSSGASLADEAARAAAFGRGAGGDRGGSGSARRALAAAEDAALRRLAAGRGAATGGPASTRDVALLLRRRPVELLRLVAGHAAPAVRGLLADGGTMALLLAALPAAERNEAEALARLLTGPAARAILSPGALAASLAAAVSSVLLGRRSVDFAEAWREALAAAASPRERARLERILPPPRGGHRAAAAAPPSEAPPGSAAWLLALLESPSPDSRRTLSRLLRSPALRRRLARRLPPYLLARLLAAARPREARALLAAAGLAAAAGGGLAREAIWEAALVGAAAPEGAAVARFAALILDSGAGAPLLEPLLRRARAAAHGPLCAVLEERSAEAKRGAPDREATSPAPVPGPADPRSPFGPGQDEARALAVRNAGLVLASPYLPRLFETIGLVAPDAAGRLAWIEPEAAGRGVHLLQYLVDGRTDAPEPLLPLNKILCGLDPAWPVLASVEATAAERATCDSLLEAIIAHWPMLSGSSVAALRETFLQREGKISRVEPGWKLEVERKVLDVLVDAIPWSFSMVFAPWMPEPLSVSW